MTDDDPPNVPTEGVHLLASAMGETSGQCAAFYSGIDQQCPNDGVVYSSNSGRRGSWTPFPICEKHAAEWATCQCGGEEPELQFHLTGICTDSLDELERHEDPDEQPEQEHEFEDFFSPA